MVNALSLVNALVAILPAGVLFFTAYGRYDGHFRDQTVFLHFMGGLLLGGLLGFATLVVYAIDAPLLQVLVPALLWPVALVSVVNRRKWQGERHAVFNGGALGLGVAVMVGFSFLFTLVRTLTPAGVGQGALVAVGLTGLFFGLGLLAGDGARRKKPFRVALLGTAILFAPSVLLVEFFVGRAWLWAILFAVYGAIVALAAERRLLHEGLDEDARRKRRRAKRTREA